MRNLKKALGLITALVLSATTFGQIATYKADPTNYQAISSQIMEDIEAVSGPSAQDVELFLQDAVNIPTYDPNCLDQIEVQAEYDEDNLFLSWSSLSNPDYFEVRYFNMDTGDQFLGTTTNNNFTFSNVPDGTYILAVNSVCEIQNQTVVSTSLADIIIEDKAVLFILPDDTIVNDCDCSNETNVISAYDIQNTNDIFTGRLDFEPAIGAKYLLKYYLDNEVLNSMEMVAIAYNSPYNMIAFEVDCFDKIFISTDTPNWVHAQAPGFTSRGLLHVENANQNNESYQWYFSDFGNFDKITLSECVEDPPGNDDPRKRLSSSDEILNTDIFPNPTFNEVTIHVNSSEDETRILTVYNQLGQKILVEQLELNSTIINMDKYPSGIYNFVVSSKDEMISATPVVKK